MPPHLNVCPSLSGPLKGLFHRGSPLALRVNLSLKTFLWSTHLFGVLMGHVGIKKAAAFHATKILIQRFSASLSELEERERVTRTLMYHAPEGLDPTWRHR